MVPVYFAHSYRDKDRRINEHFLNLMKDKGFSPCVDIPSNRLNAAKQERQLGVRGLGMVAGAIQPPHFHPPAMVAFIAAKIAEVADSFKAQEARSCQRHTTQVTCPPPPRPVAKLCRPR